MWLAIDTATDLASVAVGPPPEARASAQIRGARRHAAELVPTVAALLDRLELTPRELGGIVVGDGPGSFTGLRIGWATAKGLAQQWGLEVRTVPSLLAAAAVAPGEVGVPVAAWFDALRGEIFGALYAVHETRVEALVTPVVLTPEEFVARSPRAAARVVGDGALRYDALVRRWTGTAPIGPEALRPGAAMLLRLLHHEGAVRVLEDPMTAEPSYGRAAEAQVRWEAVHGPLPDPSGSPR